MRLLLIAALLASAAPVLANDTTAELGTGGLAFITTDEIKMESEDLFVSPDQVKRTTIGLPANVSAPSKMPMSPAKEPTTGGSRMQRRVSAQ